MALTDHTPNLPCHFLPFLRCPWCRILIQLQTDKLFLIFSFHPAWRLGSKNQYQLAGDQAASDWGVRQRRPQARRGRGPGGQGRLTKCRELLARGPQGCDFSGLERAALGRPLEQLGQEFTVAEVPLENSPDASAGREGGQEQDRPTLCVASPKRRLDSLSTTLRGRLLL